MSRSSLRPLPCVTAVLSLSGWTFRSNRDRPQTRGAWASDPVLAGELAEWALGWVTSGELVTGSEVFLRASGVAMKVDARSAPALLRSAFGRARADAEVGAYAGVSEGRRVRFDTAGRVIVESRSTSRGWEEVVAELTEVVRANAARVDYAFIRQAWMFSLGLFDVSNRMPPRLPHHSDGTAPTRQLRETPGPRRVLRARRPCDPAAHRQPPGASCRPDSLGPRRDDARPPPRLRTPPGELVRRSGGWPGAGRARPPRPSPPDPAGDTLMSCISRPAACAGSGPGPLGLSG